MSLCAYTMHAIVTAVRTRAIKFIYFSFLRSNVNERHLVRNVVYQTLSSMNGMNGTSRKINEQRTRNLFNQILADCGCSTRAETKRLHWSLNVNKWRLSMRFRCFINIKRSMQVESNKFDKRSGHFEMKLTALLQLAHMYTHSQEFTIHHTRTHYCQNDIYSQMILYHIYPTRTQYEYTHTYVCAMYLCVTQRRMCGVRR